MAGQGRETASSREEWPPIVPSRRCGASAGPRQGTARAAQWGPSGLSPPETAAETVLGVGAALRGS